MAKEKGKFQLNKGSDHNFDISKGKKRTFDLTKDHDEEPVAAAPVPAPAPVPSPAPASATVNPTQVMDNTEPEQGGSGKMKWIGIIAILAALGLLAWWFFGLEKSTEQEPASEPAVEVVDQAQEASTPVADAPEANQTAEPTGEAEAPEVATPEVATPEQTPAQPEAPTATPAPAAPAQQAQTPAAQVTRPVATATPVAVSNDIEAEALKVIRGDYGIGEVRKANLGAKYAQIQARVNELKRQGAF